MNPRPGVLVCACKRDGTIMVDDPIAFAREEHKKGGSCMQMVYKILLVLCLFGLSVLVPAGMVLITREQVREEERHENP